MQIIHKDIGNGKKKTYAVYTEEEKQAIREKIKKAKHRTVAKEEDTSGKLIEETK